MFHGAEQATSDEHVASAADHERAVDGSLDPGELGAGFGAEAGVVVIDLLEAEDQGVIGEAMVAGER
jgi:hypothetical protein